MRKSVFLGTALLGLAMAQFSDVHPSSPEWLALQALSEMGVVYGYPDGSFKPDRAASRREVVIMLYRLWIKAKEENDKALQEATAKLAQDLAGLAKVQTELQSRLEALEASVMSNEEAEEIRAQIAALKSASASLEEAVSRLVSQYADLAAMYKDLEGRLAQMDQRTLAFSNALKSASASLEEAVSRLVSQYADLAAMYKDLEGRLAQMDQRTLAFSEDSVNLQKGLKDLAKRVEDLKGELARATQALQEAQAQDTSALRKAIQDQEAALRSAADAVRQEVGAQVKELADRLSALQSRVEALEGRLTETREELFNLSEGVRNNQAALAARLDAIEKTPPPLYLGATLSGLNPLVLYGFVGHDTLAGLGVRAGLDWRQDVGEFRLSGLFTLPIYREPARGGVGFGLAYAVSGPAQGESALLLAVGAGVSLWGGLEAYAEGRAFYPLDGATPFARFGLGLRFRP
jgi:predicted  nucleic acid-binding Zn-ribbon protein